MRSLISSIVLLISVIVTIKAQVLDPYYIKSKVTGEFNYHLNDYRNKFGELPYLTGRDLYPVLYSLTLSWETTKLRVSNLFNPLPCGNCKEFARKIETEINFNTDTFREEYTIDRLRVRLLEGFRDGYERLLKPADTYIVNFKPYTEQLKNILPCWEVSKPIVQKIVEETFNYAKGNITQKISEFSLVYQKMGVDFDEGVKNATTECKSCTSYSQGFGYCEFLYFSDYFPVFEVNFKKMKRQAYDMIEQFLKGLEDTMLKICTEARLDYANATSQLDLCFSKDVNVGK